MTVENPKPRQKIRLQREAESLRRNLELRKKQQAEREALKKSKKDSESTQN